MKSTLPWDHTSSPASLVTCLCVTSWACMRLVVLRSVAPQVSPAGVCLCLDLELMLHLLLGVLQRVCRSDLFIPGTLDDPQQGVTKGTCREEHLLGSYSVSCFVCWKNSSDSPGLLSSLALALRLGSRNGPTVFVELSSNFATSRLLCPRESGKKRKINISPRRTKSRDIRIRLETVAQVFQLVQQAVWYGLWRNTWNSDFSRSSWDKPCKCSTVSPCIDFICSKFWPTYCTIQQLKLGVQ